MSRVGVHSNLHYWIERRKGFITWIQQLKST